MTTFLDGPAKGQKLLLRNSPNVLTVVVGQDGKWDALDMPGDAPRLTEVAHRYRLVERSGTAHVNFGRGRGGFFAIASYRYEPAEAKA